MHFSVVDDGVKIRRVVIKPTVLLGIGACSIGEEELWLRPRASPVLRQRYPDFTAIPHAVHGAAQPAVLCLYVAIMVKSDQRFTIGEMEQHRRGIGVYERRGCWRRPTLAVVCAARFP